MERVWGAVTWTERPEAERARSERVNLLMSSLFPLAGQVDPGFS
jgi:hypothetical protein